MLLFGCCLGLDLFFMIIIIIIFIVLEILIRLWTILILLIITNKTQGGSLQTPFPPCKTEAVYFSIVVYLVGSYDAFGGHQINFL